MKWIILIGLSLTIALQLFFSCMGDNIDDDFATLAEMKQSILEVIGDAPCNDISDCRFTGLGAKACGGPWEFVVYSIVETDTTLLAEMIKDYNNFEKELNRKYGLASDCSIPSAPTIGVTNGRCVDLDD